MEKEEAKDYIDDQVRHATDSAIMALTRVIGDYNNKLEKHREEEAKFKEKLIDTIREEIKVTVNGKIDNIKKTQDKDREIHEKFMSEVRDFITGVKPIKNEFDEKQKAFSYASKKGKTIIYISGIITALIIIRVFLIDLIKYIR